MDPHRSNGALCFEANEDGCSEYVGSILRLIAWIGSPIGQLPECSDSRGTRERAEWLERVHPLL